MENYNVQVADFFQRSQETPFDMDYFNPEQQQALVNTVVEHDKLIRQHQQQQQTARTNELFEQAVEKVQDISTVPLTRDMRIGLVRGAYDSTERQLASQGKNWNDPTFQQLWASEIDKMIAEQFPQHIPANIKVGDTLTRTSKYIDEKDGQIRQEKFKVSITDDWDMGAVEFGRGMSKVRGNK